jgi:NADPH-dependent curcumin reductase CurA
MRLELPPNYADTVVLSLCNDCGDINTCSYKEGKVKTKETIVDGFENTPTAFSGLFTGANTGKMVVKL